MLTLSSSLRGLIAAARDSKHRDPAAFPILADCLEECGAPDLALRLRGNVRAAGWALHEIERECFRRGLLRWEDEPSWQKAVAFQTAIAAVDISSIPVLTTDRHIDRREQAALLRRLLKLLRIPHVSVTTPRYSMASTVDIRLPTREDYERDADGCLNRDCPAAVANREAEDRLKDILAMAFPNHDDRSDTQTDYFDYCWSISG